MKKEKNEEQKRKRSKVPFVILGTAAVVAGIVIPPLLVKNCKANKTIEERNITIVEMKSNAVSLKANISSLEAQLIAKNSEIAALRRELEQTQEKLKLARFKLLEYVGSEDENFVLENDYSNAAPGSVIYILREQIKQLESSNEAKDQEIAKKKQELVDALAEIEQLKEEIQNKNSEIELLSSNLANANNTIEELKAKLEEKNRENEELREEIKRQLAASQKQKEDLEFKIAQLNGDNETKDRIIAEQRNQLNSLNERIAELERLIEEQNETIRQNNERIASLISEKEMNKSALLSSIIQYRQNLKDLLAQVEESKNSLIESVNEDLGNDVNAAKQYASKEDKAKYDEILKLLFAKTDLETLINNGNAKLSLIKNYDSDFADENLNEVSVTHTWKTISHLDEEMKNLYESSIDLDDEEFKALLVENGTVKQEVYTKYLNLLNSLKDQIQNNLDTLKEARVQNIASLSNSYHNLEVLLNTLSDKYNQLVGETPYETDLGTNGKSANGGIVKELNTQIKTLKASLSKAESKLLNLYGSTDADFDLGNDGENALGGSYIKVIYDKLKQSEENLAAKRLESLQKDREIVEKGEKISELEAKNSEKENQIQTKNREIQSQSSQISSLNSQINSKDQEIESLREENERLRNSNGGNAAELERLRSENQQKEQRINELERQNATQRQTINSLTSERNQALSDAEYWRNQYNKAIQDGGSGSSNAEELGKAKQKLMDLMGTDDPAFDLGTDGENAKANSYIYDLNAKIQNLTRDNKNLRFQLNQKEMENSNLKQMLASIRKVRVIVGTQEQNHSNIHVVAGKTIEFNDAPRNEKPYSTDPDLAFIKTNGRDRLEIQGGFTNGLSSTAVRKFIIPKSSIGENSKLRINGIEKSIDNWKRHIQISWKSINTKFLAAQKLLNYGVPIGPAGMYDGDEYWDHVGCYQISERRVEWVKSIRVNFTTDNSNFIFTITEIINAKASVGEKKYIAYFSDVNRESFGIFGESKYGAVVLVSDIDMPSEFSRAIDEILLID